MLLQTDAAKNLVEEKNKYNNTALHLASMRGHNEMVKVNETFTVLINTKQ